MPAFDSTATALLLPGARLADRDTARFTRGSVEKAKTMVRDFSIVTLEEFRSTIGHAEPPTVSRPLLALWHAAKENWGGAHQIAQEIDDADGAWVHAYLHRKEGDLGNARYWYQRARQPEATDSLDDEWTRIARALLGS